MVCASKLPYDLAEETLWCIKKMKGSVTFIQFLARLFVPKWISAQVCDSVTHYAFTENGFKAKFLQYLLPRFDTSLQDQILSVQTMPARKMRNLLLQDLHVPRRIVDQLLDRRELRDLTISVLLESNQHTCIYHVQDILFQTIFYSLLISIMVYNQQAIRDLFFNILLSIFDVYRMQIKMKLVRKSFKNLRSMYGGLAGTISIILEVVLAWVQFSVLLSWIVPLHSDFAILQLLRKAIFTGPALPLSPATFLKAGGNRINAAGFESWSINAGPMVFIMVIRYLAGRLDDFSAASLIEARSGNEQTNKHHGPYNNNNATSSSGLSDQDVVRDRASKAEKYSPKVRSLFGVRPNEDLAFSKGSLGNEQGEAPHSRVVSDSSTNTTKVTRVPHVYEEEIVFPVDGADIVKVDSDLEFVKVDSTSTSLAN